MPRRRTKTVLTPEQKKQSRKIKRELRKANAAEGGSMIRPSDVQEKTPHEDRQFWLGTTARLKANAVLNSSHVRPYWLSIPDPGAGGPISPFYPCTSFTRQGRRYYGFTFREHRDRCWTAWDTIHRARKELTGSGQVPLFP